MSKWPPITPPLTPHPLPHILAPTLPNHPLADKFDEPFTHPARDVAASTASSPPVVEALCLTNPDPLVLVDILKRAADLNEPDVQRRKSPPFFLCLATISRLSAWNAGQPVKLGEAELFAEVRRVIALEEEARWKVMELEAQRCPDLRETLDAIGKERFHFDNLVKEYKQRVCDHMVAVSGVIESEIEDLRRTTLEHADKMDVSDMRSTLAFPHALDDAVRQFQAGFITRMGTSSLEQFTPAVLNKVYLADERVKGLDASAPLDLRFAVSAASASPEFLASRSDMATVGAPWGVGMSLVTSLANKGLQISFEGLTRAPLEEGDVKIFYSLYTGVVDRCLARMAGIVIKSIDVIALKEAVIDIHSPVEKTLDERVANEALKHIKEIWTQGIYYIISSLDVALKIMRTETVRYVHLELSTKEDHPFWRQPRPVAKLEAAAAQAHAQFLAEMRDELLEMLNVDRCREDWLASAESTARAMHGAAQLYNFTMKGTDAFFTSNQADIVQQLRKMLGPGQVEPRGGGGVATAGSPAAATAAAMPAPASTLPPIYVRAAATRPVCVPRVLARDAPPASP